MQRLRAQERWCRTTRLAHVAPLGSKHIGLTGDYVWSNQRLPYSQSGQWGYFRVLPVGDQRILPLSSGAVGAQKAEAQPEAPVATPTALQAGK